MNSEMSHYKTTPNLAAAPQGIAIAVATTRLLDLIQEERQQASTGAFDGLRHQEHAYRCYDTEFRASYAADTEKLAKVQEELAMLRERAAQCQDECKMAEEIQRLQANVQIVQTECDKLRSQLAAVQRADIDPQTPDSGGYSTHASAIAEFKRSLESFGILYHSEHSAVSFSPMWQQLLVEIGAQELGLSTPEELQAKLNGVAEKLISGRMSFQLMERLIVQCKEEKEVRMGEYEERIAMLNERIASLE